MDDKDIYLYSRVQYNLTLNGAAMHAAGLPFTRQNEMTTRITAAEMDLRIYATTTEDWNLMISCQKEQGSVPEPSTVTVHAAGAGVPGADLPS